MAAARPCGAALFLAALLLGSAAPDPIQVVDGEGGAVSLALRPGEAGLVAHFWATWCASCTEELPALARAARACRGAPVRVLTVNVGEDAETVARYLAEHPFELPVLRDPQGRAWRRIGRGLPANVIWTRAGRRHEVGPRTAEVWHEELLALGCDPDPDPG